MACCTESSWQTILRLPHKIGNFSLFQRMWPCASFEVFIAMFQREVLWDVAVCPWVRVCVVSKPLLFLWTSGSQTANTASYHRRPESSLSELVKEDCDALSRTALLRGCWVRLTFGICVLRCPMFGSLHCPYKPAPLPLVIDPFVLLLAGSVCYFMQHNSAIAGA